MENNDPNKGVFIDMQQKPVVWTIGSGIIPPMEKNPFVFATNDVGRVETGGDERMEGKQGTVVGRRVKRE